MKTMEIKNEGMAGEDKDPALAIHDSFLSWFNNHMALIVMALEYVRRRQPGFLMKVEFFLHGIEHHYLRPSRDKFVTDAFRYLRRYFKVYPNVKIEHSQRAFEMVGRIYAALGLELELQTESFSNEGGLS